MIKSSAFLITILLLLFIALAVNAASDGSNDEEVETPQEGHIEVLSGSLDNLQRSSEALRKLTASVKETIDHHNQQFDAMTNQMREHLEGSKRAAEVSATIIQWMKLFMRATFTVVLTFGFVMYFVAPDDATEKNETKLRMIGPIRATYAAMLLSPILALLIWFGPSAWLFNLLIRF